jgi:hypothetical protein
MGKSYRRTIVFVAMAALFVLLTATSAFALTANTQQLTPGMTTRTIWDTSQVAVYEVGNGTNYVNHTGYIHMEVSWMPRWADLDIYLLNADGETLSEEMGYMATFYGKEVIDYRVPSISMDGRTIVTPEYGDPYMVGDKYYVVIVAFNDAARYQIRGYYPQIDLSVGNSTTNQWNYYIEPFRKPDRASAWASIRGPQWGGAYAFRPTSTGEGVVELEWPADVKAKVVSDDHANDLRPANMEQYVWAGADYDTIVENYGDANWLPGEIAPGRFGLQDAFNVEVGGLAAPGKPMWYVPSLYLVTSDPLEGPFAAPKLGRSTMGFKATVTWPENLRLRIAPSSVRKGSMATVRGSFALNGDWAAGMKVTIQRKTAKGWAKVTTTKVAANGQWVAKFRVSATNTYRAMAAGDAGTGLATEYSVSKRIRAR